MTAGEHWSGILRAAAAAALATCLVAGSLLLWIGLPVIGLWAAGELTRSGEGFLLVSLLGVPSAMVGFGWLLYRLAAVHDRLSGHADGPTPRAAWLVASSDERRKFRRARAPRSLIDVAMTGSAIAALVLLAVWFFFLAESPLAPLP
jgi:hypothetical protein